MTVSRIRVRVPTRFPSSVSVASPLVLVTTGGAFVFSLDATALEITLGAVYQPLDGTLTALAALDSTAGLLTQTGADTFVRRTLTGTANEITITNGSGASGAPTLSLPASMTFTGKTITGGTYAGIAITGALPITSTSATALSVGPAGSTDPSLSVDASTASAVAGLRVKGAVTSGRVTIDVTDSGTNASLGINAKGNGDIAIGNISTGPVSITPALTLGATINKLTLTAPATAATLTILNNKTATINNTLTFAGTDGTTMTFPTTSATMARTDAANTFTGNQVFSGTINGVTIDNLAWTSYTPTVTAGAGTPTTTTLSGRYKQIGKTVLVEIDIIVNTVGTASGTMNASLPFTGAAFRYGGSAVDYGLTLLSGSAFLTTGATTAVIRKYDSTTFWATGAGVAVSITYEVP